MANGVLAKDNIPAGYEYLLYDFNTNGTTTATVNLNVINFGTTPALIDIKISAGDNTFDDYIVYQYELKPKEFLEKVGIVLSLYERIIVKSDSPDTTWRVHGFEEELEYPSGKLGAIKPKKNTLSALYIFNTEFAEVSTFNLYVVNLGSESCKIKIAISDSDTVTGTDYIVHDYEIDSYNDLEIAGIMIGINEQVMVESSNSDTVFRVSGFEENISKLKGNVSGDVNVPPSMINLTHTIPSTVKGGSQLQNIEFRGVVDNNGDSVSLTISDIKGNISFNNTTNILLNSPITMDVPFVSTYTVVSFQLTALDNKGGTSTRRISFVIEP